MRVRLGTRGSDLALTQSKWVAGQLAAAGVECELVIIATEGDVNQSDRFADIGAAGVFVRSIEAALLDERVDLAVHSYKDLPSRSPPGLTIAAIPPRADCRDVLLVGEGGFDAAAAAAGKLPLAPGASVGTASARRCALLEDLRPDVRLVHLRGNVPGRIGKLRAGQADAIVLAAAGIARLQAGDVDLALDGIHLHHLDPVAFVPAPAQGALAVQAREADEPLVSRLVEVLDDRATRHSLAAERALLALLDGGCDIALGAWCRPTGAEGDELELLAAWGTDGHVLRNRMVGRDPAAIAGLAFEDLQRQRPGEESP